MSATTTVTLELPAHALTNHREPIQRSMIRHLLYDERITMSEALDLLSVEDQIWLVGMVLLDAQKNLALIAQLTDAGTKVQYWQHSQALLGNLLQWREKWTPYHRQLLAILRLVLQRYSPDVLTAKQCQLVLMLTRRLSEEQLSREDIISATKLLKAEGLNPHLNLVAADSTLFDSYIEELGRT